MRPQEDGDDLPGADPGGPEEQGPVLRQAAALAFLPDSRPLRFVLVTTRRTGRWSLPKGGIEEGLNGPATAVREAYEEAGVLGPAETAPVGAYRARKIRPPNVWPIEVEVFPVAVREIRDRWPESNQRQRRFVTIDEARALLADPVVLGLAEGFVRARS